MTINIEVVYALPEQQSLLSLQVSDGCTAIEAVRKSEIVKLHPEIDINTINLGIFSKACKNEQPLNAGDRVEIYRPLKADPNEIRKRRAAEMAAKRKK